MLKITNNASALVGATLLAADTQLTLASGAGTKFPSLGADDWCPLTLVKASDPSQLEIVRCTERVGDLLTVERAQEGTTAKEFAPGDVVELRLTAGALAEAFPQYQDVALVVDSDGGVKGLQFSLAAMGAGVTRTITMPNADVNLGAFPWAYIDGKPTTFAPSAHTHPYLPLAGGTMAGLFATRVSAGAWVLNTSGEYTISVRGDATSGAVMSFLRVGVFGLNMGLDVDNTFRLGGWSDGATSRFTADAGGNFHVRSNISAGGNITAYSDRRLKQNIQPINDALAKVEALTGVVYDRIDTGERQTGLIAQDVRLVMPEAVIEGNDENRTLSVAYGNLVGLLVEAVKELHAELRELKAPAGG